MELAFRIVGSLILSLFLLYAIVVAIAFSHLSGRSVFLEFFDAAWMLISTFFWPVVLGLAAYGFAWWVLGFVV